MCIRDSHKSTRAICQKEEIKATKPIKDNIQENSQQSDLAKAKPIKKQPKAGMIINDRVIK